jgi:hypothetical protein
VRRALPALILVGLPDVVYACAVCGAAVDRSKSLFLGTTILLSLLPLALIGAGLWWIARNAGGHLAGEVADVELPVGAPRAGRGTGA